MTHGTGPAGEQLSALRRLVAGSILPTQVDLRARYSIKKLNA